MPLNTKRDHHPRGDSSSARVSLPPSALGPLCGAEGLLDATKEEPLAGLPQNPMNEAVCWRGEPCRYQGGGAEGLGRQGPSSGASREKSLGRGRRRAASTGSFQLRSPSHLRRDVAVVPRHFADGDARLDASWDVGGADIRHVLDLCDSGHGPEACLIEDREEEALL